MRVVFTHSHAFPGARAAVVDEGGAGSGCLVEFGDGVTLVAGWRREGERIVLDVPGYRTAKGNPVAPRRWRLRQAAEGGWRAERA